MVTVSASAHAYAACARTSADAGGAPAAIGASAPAGASTPAEPEPATGNGTPGPAAEEGRSSGPAAEEELRALAGTVPDPELPVLTLDELGVVRGARVTGPGWVEIELTPTYTGCPALEAMAADIGAVLRDHGWKATIAVVLSPAWTTDWISDEGRRKLAEAGIAPPGPVRGGPARSGPVLLGPAPGVRCPRCGSVRTELRSRFSSTACKALRSCADCGEPFEHVKEV